MTAVVDFESELFAYLDQFVEAGSDAQRAFIQSEDGIVWFVRDVLGAEPAPYQEHILRALIRYKRVAVRGPHGLGKTALASWVILWGLVAFPDDVKIPTTASAWRQLKEFLWPEVRKWARGAKWNLVGMTIVEGRDLLDLSIRIREHDKAAFAVASNNPALIEGAHAKHIIYVFDESKSIPDSTWDAAEGAFSTAGDDGTIAYALAISTPGSTSGRFYDIHKRRPGYDDWHTIHVTLAEAVKAGRITTDWVDARRDQWGESSGVFLNRVLGEFDESGEENVIPLAWIDAAVDRWHERKNRLSPGKRVHGLDVARFGEDATTLATLHDEYDFFDAINYFPKSDTMRTVGTVRSFVGRYDEMAVDVIGVGAGVFDRLREAGYKVFANNAGEATPLRDSSGEIGFINVRAAMWWAMREALDPSNNPTIALPDDPRLIGDLTAPKWWHTSKGLIQVESKDDLRKRIKRSTDSADAVLMAYFLARIGGSGWKNA